MLVLFDNGTPHTLARYLIARHTVTEHVLVDGIGSETANCWRLPNRQDSKFFSQRTRTSAINKTLQIARSRWSRSGKVDGH